MTACPDLPKEPRRKARRKTVKPRPYEYHESVLLAETVEALAPAPGRVIVDGTLGGAGHTAALLAAGARVIGLTTTLAELPRVEISVPNFEDPRLAAWDRRPVCARRCARYAYDADGALSPRGLWLETGTIERTWRAVGTTGEGIV